ncbi:ABC transporter permease [Lignipirellula cremea]|uniref:Transport permease protein n=1 Tax=Lignipirellula cremea TaxID=2528010 RepID=A0A518DL23_9BACT|nr:ABC transporter permease [Lignipirellula cremea]QDU92537.1 Teichoic acid translocation permease protein TagG [Lignipirellula cremea]
MFAQTTDDAAELSPPEPADANRPPAPDDLRYYQAQPGWRPIDLRELWRRRELIWILAARDLKVRYRQTAVGVAWALLQPLAMMTIFSLFFWLLGREPVEAGVPYAAALLCGLLPWQLLANTLTSATQSLVAHQNLVTKVYFPRAILPLSATIGGLVDFGVGFLLLAAALIWFGVVPSWPILLAPVFVLLTLLVSLALGLWLSAMNALYRDIGYVVPFLLQVGMFASPVVYQTSALIPEPWRVVFALNPMVGVLDGFRWSMLGHDPPALAPLLVSCVMLLLLLVGGMFYFRRVERFLADRI